MSRKYQQQARQRLCPPCPECAQKHHCQGAPGPQVQLVPRGVCLPCGWDSPTCFGQHIYAQHSHLPEDQLPKVTSAHGSPVRAGASPALPLIVPFPTQAGREGQLEASQSPEHPLRQLSLRTLSSTQRGARHWVSMLRLRFHYMTLFSACRRADVRPQAETPFLLPSQPLRSLCPDMGETLPPCVPCTGQRRSGASLPGWAVEERRTMPKVHGAGGEVSREGP